MAKLHITDADGSTRTYLLTTDRVSIGRHPENDIALPDKAVSGRHAMVIAENGSFSIEDLQSTNGTQVNGRPVTKQALVHDDEVQIGRNRLKFEGDPTAQDDFDRTTILGPEQLRRLTAAAPRPPAPVKPATLSIESGPNAGKVLSLSKPMSTIGKPGAQVAAVTRRTDGYYIMHVGGEKRPLLNGRPIEGQAHKLSEQDVIEVMGTKMRFSNR